LARSRLRQYDLIKSNAAFERLGQEHRTLTYCEDAAVAMMSDLADQMAISPYHLVAAQRVADCPALDQPNLAGRRGTSSFERWLDSGEGNLLRSGAKLLRKAAQEELSIWLTHRKYLVRQFRTPVNRLVISYPVHPVLLHPSYPQRPVG